MPAVGKLAVAKQLAEITGFRLFHNHLTADYVSSLFPLRNKISDKLKCEIAYIMFEAAAKHGINLIFTMAHQVKYDNFVKNVINIIEKFNGKILFVKLFCKKEKLYERITKNSRKKFGKANTVGDLNKILKRGNKFKTIPFKKSLIIDNTNLSPKKCAQKIKEYYKL